MKSNRSHLVAMVSPVLGNIIKAMIDNVKIALSSDKKAKDGADKDANDAQGLDKQTLAFLTRKHNAVMQASTAKNVVALALPSLIDPKFDESVDKIEHLLPISHARVVDLRTCRVLPRLATHRFTRECPLDITNALLHSPQPLATQFFSKLMCDDPDMLEYLQRWLGYIITGEVLDRGLYIMYGTGKNGKGTLVKVLKAGLVDFYAEGSSSIFIDAKRSSAANAHSSHLMVLKTARVVMCSESDNGAVLKASLLKNVSGDGDTISAREVHEQQTQFITQAKACLQTNFKPEFDGADKAMTDRIRCIPFLQRFEKEPAQNEAKADPNWVKTLVKDHLNELFAWIIVGSCKWYGTQNLDLPESAAALQREYAHAHDPVEQFLEAMCDMQAPDHMHEDEKLWRVQKLALYNSFRAWWQKEANEGAPMTKRAFNHTMQCKGFKVLKSGALRSFSGLREKPKAPQDVGVDPNQIQAYTGFL
jgi:putative DNA primase/helicase